MTDRSRGTILEAAVESGIAVEQFGATFLVLRTLRGLSLKQVARAAQIPVKNLVELESGMWSPPDAVVLDVLEILEVDLPYFLVALRDVKFIDELAQRGRKTHAPGRPMLILGDGLSLPKEGAGGGGEGDGNNEPN